MVAVLDRDTEKVYRQGLAYAGAGLLLKGKVREGFALILASQALYSRQLSEVMGKLDEGDIDEAVWLAFGYTHHPTLEKRPPLLPPEGGWKPLWRLMARENLNSREEPGATLVALAHTAHLGELTAVLVTDERRGFAKALEVAKAILEYRPMAFRYGLHQVSGALPQTR
ncbi:hypothetical protein [Thermus tengchongensis]|uniref:hypothetical protein n=1 Tax=Thermus tengchongensis TaxID=1214928 RepID=UPI000571B432|nr:hypothetical protein [Thermus tengchongensis]